MAPNFRQNTQTRRGNRSGYVEHDDFEGLPVRQWRQEWVKIAPPPPSDTTQKNDVWAIELPHGMPKDSHLLPTHTQELLRAARSGRLYKRPPPAEEEEVDPDAALAEKPDKKEEDPSTKGYQVKVWKQVARNAEGSTISHLAKRRKGLITLSSSIPAGPSSGPTIMKATVRRVDAAGNPYTQEITLNEGQPVDGEIISTTIVPIVNPAASADTPVAATPARRRPPPPKRKPKGPGRGRKKKLPLPVNTRPEVVTTDVDSTTGSTKLSGPEVGKIKPGDLSESKNQDSEMADDDEGDDGEDDGEEGDDGDEGDEEDSEMPDGDGVATFQVESEIKDETKAGPSPALEASTIALAEPLTEATPVDVSTEASLPPTKSPSPPPNINLPPTQSPLPHIPSHFEGSPLRNVMAAATPTTDSSSKFTLENGEPSNPITTFETRPPEVSLEPTPVLAEPASLVGPNETKIDVDVEMSGVSHTGHSDIVEQPTSVRGRQQSGDAAFTNMLPTPDKPHVEESPTTRPSPEPTAVPETLGALHLIEDDVPKTSMNIESNQEPLGSDTAPAPVDITLAPELVDTKIEPTVVERAEENEPESPDLFSGLEAALNQQGGPSEPSAPPEVRTDMHKSE
ncbi:uncharacterized protein GGS22DRAFT_159867 [Annulohypoxylon maeteangense]|uniref:uncharacterized protein n=1 Tax=Annulohypoxylon maeteangense TaxID=1927788 RepID=UPI0020084124|nr:uncharacterized protein GGS22DRAFT_159867 [Annulohypoxylon maeteangense]KAI0886091.1 hypothetical protein GGS22DRAFT_159867 [Annulohypoxylon maeteangense]